MVGSAGGLDGRAGISAFWAAGADLPFVAGSWLAPGLRRVLDG